MNRLASVAVSILICMLTLFLAEGIFSVVRWKVADRSVLYQAYRKFMIIASDAAQPDLRLASRDEIEALMPDMVKDHVGLGNAPYKKLKNERSAINTTTDDGCIFPKPMLKKPKLQSFNAALPPTL